MNDNFSQKELPFVSIIMPAKNEAHCLPRVFAALEKLDYPTERREVILVDNGSSDATADIARRHGALVIVLPGVYVGALRNTGARRARGEVLAFVDADCLVPTGWLREAVRLLADERIGAVGGGCRVPPEGNWVERAWISDEPALDREVDAIAASSFLMRRDTFEDLGGFDPDLSAGEDDDLSHRVRAAGYRLREAHECCVIHLGYPRSLRDVARRQLWHGRSQLQARHGMEPMLLLTHAFAVCAFLAAPYALFTGQWLLLGVVGLSMAVIAGIPASLKSFRSGPPSAALLLQRVVVYGFFFLGRALGLVMSYRDLLTRGMRRVARLMEGGKA